MSTTNTPEMFAYGRHKIEGRACPIVAAGRSVKGVRHSLAQEYDDAVRDALRTAGIPDPAPEGTVHESWARVAWQAVADELRTLIEHAGDDQAEAFYRERLTASEEIADALGWD